MIITTLKDETRQLLLNRPRSLTLATISKDLGISLNWFTLFSKDQIPNPGVVTIETLNVYLKNYKL